MQIWKFRLLLVSGALVLAVACSTRQAGNETPTTGTGIAVDPATATASITGTVTVEGAAPPQSSIQLSADPTCAALHKAPLLTEDVVVRNGRLQNVFVWIKSGLEKYSFPPPAEPATLTQDGCRFAPHVGGIMVNQKLRIVNSDPTLHNIHCLAEKNPQFNIGQPLQGMTAERTFTTPEVMVGFKCDVHKWMRSYIGVVPHPYFSVTQGDGTYTLKNLPPGDYVIEAWHEKFGTRSQNISVGDREAREVNFSFAATL